MGALLRVVGWCRGAEEGRGRVPPEQCASARMTVEAVLSPEEHAALVRAGRHVEIDEEKTRGMNELRSQDVSISGISGYACYRTWLPDSVSLALSASTVTQGTPVTLTARADDTRYGTVGGIESSQAIAAARYTIDSPSWVTGTPTYAMSAVDGAFSSTAESVQATVFTSGLAPGRHTLFVESRDASGNWGVPTSIFLNVQ
ncbi:hypothetical protein [Archangium sp.]|uniref:hypothetical protein n=1 Tax=Archangium sp. TaxID=1872627 RepID=UPI002D6BBE6E|nr:hypothetical protein [Archangium sp.]HYO59793.1 hypothetical protein [Archangium sp.]